MTRAALDRALVARIARGRPYLRTAAPEVVLAELAALPDALQARERATRLTLAILAVPLPLALVPVGHALDAGIPPAGLLLCAAPVALVAWLAREGWNDRVRWGVPWGAHVVEHVLRGLAWKQGSAVSVVASHALGGEDDLVVWSLEGELGSGARMVASRALARGTREARQSAVLEIEQRRPWALARSQSALEQLGFDPAEQRVTATSIGWSRAMPRSADRDEPDDLVTCIERLLETLPDEREASGAGYRDAPRPAPVGGGIERARVQGEAWAARVWAAVLAIVALGVVIASGLAVVTGGAPSTLSGATVGGAGVVGSVSLACGIAWRLVRDARGAR